MADQLGSTNDMPGETRTPQLIASVSVFLPLAISAVAVRLWVRIRMIRNVGWDDAMMIMALANFVVYCSALMVIVAYGGGTRRGHLASIKAGIVWALVAEVSYLMSILFLKISLGLFFLRVVQIKWQRKIIYGIVIMSTIVQSYHAFLLVFACGNPRYFPEHIISRSPKCIPKHTQVDLAYGQAAITTFTDLVFALLPIPLLWDTTLDRRSKLSVAFVLLLGTSGSICSMIRFKYIPGLGSIDEFFWTAANISLWSLYEIATGIIASCLATMRPLWRNVVYKARTITQKAGNTRKSSLTNNQNSRARMLSKKKSYASSASRSQSITDWSKAVDTQAYTSTCFAGADYDFAEALSDKEELANLPKGKISRKPSSASSRGRHWRDEQSIHKTVQIEVRSSQEDEQPWATAGGGKWRERMDDILRTPPKVRKGSRDDDSIAEWDRLPDLIPPSRKGSEDSQRAPPLVRITT